MFNLKSYIFLFSIGSSFAINCIPFIFNPLRLSDVVFDRNSNNGLQVNNGIKLNLTQDDGDVIIKTNELFRYGKIDAILKVSRGVNIFSSFYLESQNKDKVIFNMMHSRGNEHNTVIQSNFFYQGNETNINAKYHSVYGSLSQNWYKYTIAWFPDYYEWRINNVLLRRLNKNEIDNFPDSPSHIKFSIWEGAKPWAGRGVRWNQAPFEYQILSVQLHCYDTFTSNDSVVYVDTYMKNNSDYNGISIFMIFLSLLFSIIL